VCSWPEIRRKFWHNDATPPVCPDFDAAAASQLADVGTEISAAGQASLHVAEPAFASTLGDEPWRSALRPPADLRRLLAPRSAWAILALACGEHQFAARMAHGLDAPEASRARARLKKEGLIALLPLLAARAARAWCSVSDPTAVTALLDDPRVLSSGNAHEPAYLQGYVRASDVPALADEYLLAAAPSRFGRTILLRPVADPWPFAERGSGPTQACPSHRPA
jgi:hypothetical protein